VRSRSERANFERSNKPLERTGFAGRSAPTFGNISGELQPVRLAQTTIHCTKAIRELWPDPLARQWLQQYPDVFDGDDLRLTVNQPKNHFCEWFAAIHLFHREGARSLVEKYVFQNHPQKVAQLGRLLSERSERRSMQFERPTPSNHRISSSLSRRPAVTGSPRSKARATGFLESRSEAMMRSGEGLECRSKSSRSRSETDRLPNYAVHRPGARVARSSR